MTTLPEIDSRFEILAKLGEGGMGCVYKVRHRDLDEIQIIKTLQAHLSTNPSLRERFVNEARRGMRLRHPHIAGVHDFAVCADGTGYIVMEYVHGHNLRDLLATRGPLRLPLIGAIAVQTLDALAYLHSEKFVHRDISPDNLMLTTAADGTPYVKLIDLGIAKSLDAGQTLTATGQFIGKVHYASPEQFGGGGDIDGRSDLYSFGVVLYKLLTNTDPFPGDNYKEVITKHLFHGPRPFEEAAPGVEIPEAVKAVVLRALEKDPDKRFQDAAEFLEAVEQAFEVRDARPMRHTRPARTAPATTLVPPSDQTEVIDTADATVIDEGAPTVVDRPPVSRTRHYAIAAVIVMALLAGLLYAYQQTKAADLASYGRYYAVVVGESQYERLETLPTAVNDARAVAQLLRGRYGFDVTLLENAKGQQILDALKATTAKMSEADNLLVFYAGHGKLLNEKGYWQPVDADFEMTNWISPALLKDVLIDHPARRTLILADSCHSGALARGALASDPDAKSRREKRSRLVISSGGDAPVIDSADGRHSLFTRALLDVLNEPPSKVSDVESVFQRIRERVNDSARRAGVEQNPQLGVLAEVGDEGGSFFLIDRH
jgi:tRNA A-37 threonylcarbamoyl transferase component Bud32